MLFRSVEELVDELLAKLRNAGYGIVLIGHTKIKDIKEKNGDEYQQLTSNLSGDYDCIFANKDDIVMTIAVERDIYEKHINKTTRYMWFRTDGFVDAGGRFSEMPEKIEYGAKNYIEAFEEGVKKSIAAKKKITDSEIKKRAKEEQKLRKEKANENAEKTKKFKVDEEMNEDLIDKIKAAFPDASDKVKAKIKETMAEYNIENFKSIDVPTAGLLEIVNLLGE